MYIVICEIKEFEVLLANGVINLRMSVSAARISIFARCGRLMWWMDVVLCVIVVCVGVFFILRYD